MWEVCVLLSRRLSCYPVFTRCLRGCSEARAVYLSWGWRGRRAPQHLSPRISRSPSSSTFLFTNAKMRVAIWQRKVKSQFIVSVKLWIKWIHYPCCCADVEELQQLPPEHFRFTTYFATTTPQPNTCFWCYYPNKGIRKTSLTKITLYIRDYLYQISFLCKKLILRPNKDFDVK